MGIRFSSLLRCPLQQAQTPLQFPSTNTPVPLPNDVIFDILSRIPVKSVCRFRCVSKEWYALISDPAFLAMHKSPAEPLLVVGCRLDKSLRLMDMGGNLVKVINNVGSVLGLISTSRDNLVCVLGQSCDVKVIDLAKGDVLLTCKKGGLVGFGCSIPASVYKMVCINVDICEILTVGDGAEWRQMRLPPTPTNNIAYDRKPVVVNGVLHLLIISPLDGNNVLCFNLATEEWEKGIKSPPGVDLRPCVPLLSELNGSLCMVQPGGWTNIWLLTNSNKSTWVKVCVISLDTSWICRLIPLRILHDDESLLFCNTCGTTKLSIVQLYDASRSIYADWPKKLLAGEFDTNFSPCSLQLEGFVLAKS